MLYDFLNVNRKLAVAAYKIQRNIKGLNCIIEKPIQMNSVFGMEDSLITYDEENPITGKYLVFNLFQEGMLGFEDFDAFIQNPYLLTLYEEKLDLKSRITVNFRGRDFKFVVDEIKSPTPHIENQLFSAHILVAAT